ncbi:hypothetical protein ACFPM0_37000 [Pseudonocardia sulfidoxydans]|uniref:hypothetical protein n=1 Tax=Pseudonocardia sulfidoxydans TaxID=54011 RepID=UPI00361BE916
MTVSDPHPAQGPSSGTHGSGRSRRRPSWGTTRRVQREPAAPGAVRTGLVDRLNSDHGGP